MALRSYRDLVVWQRAMELTVESYRLSSTLPKWEMFALGSQMRRAAVSIAANVAEGYGRRNRGEYLHHLSIARGSLAELETLCMLAARVGHLTADALSPAASLSDEVGRMLLALMRSLEPPNEHRVPARGRAGRRLHPTP